MTTTERGRVTGPAPSAPRSGRPARALAGLAAALLGLGLAEPVAALLSPSSAPLVAIGDAFVDLTPPWLKDFAVSTFGTADKAVLLTGAALVTAGLAVLAGLLTRRRPRQAEWLVLGLGALAALAAVTRPDSGPLWVAPGLVAAITGVFALRLLAARLDVADVVAARPSTSAQPGATRAARRSVLQAGAAAVGVGAVGAVAGRLLGSRFRDVAASREAVRLPVAADPEPALPAGVEVGVPGVTPFRVPNADFYRIDTALVVPRVTTGDWKLRIHGMVDREITLDWDQLVGSPLVERDVTLMCVSNEVGGDLVGNATWLGLPLKGLLEQAGPHPDADMVLSSSADGWTCSTPLEVLTDGRDALLAIGMNGAPLPVEHGFPVRMVVPGLYGFVSATKWVVDLKVTRFDRDEGYWTSRGWSERAPVKTQSRIDVPAAGGTVKPGPVAVAGVAWAQHRGIDAVEVRVDGGAWQPARLGAEASVDTWRQWVFEWQATPGEHELEVRATDRTGTPQTGDRAAPAPDGATGWDRVRVTVG